MQISAIMSIRITALFIYPIKSLGGIPLEQAEVTERGLRLDRRWVIVDGAGRFITQRDYPAMARLLVAESTSPGEAITITAPDGQSVAVPSQPTGEAVPVTIWKDTVTGIFVGRDADAFLSANLGTECRLVYMPDSTRRQVSQKYAGPEHITSFADGYPVLIATEGSLADLNGRMAAPVPMDRFRANIVVENAAAFAEDEWGRFRLGTAVLEAVKPCARCIITTIDQATGEKTGKEPLKTLASFRNSEKGVRFGENLIVIEPGMVRVDDEVEFLAPRGKFPKEGVA